MIHFLDSEKDNLIAFKIEGKITKEDIQKVHPLIHKITNTGKKVDFYMNLNDFEGYETGGLWTDLKIDAIHISDYGNMAIVGDKKWHEWAAKATDLFTNSEVKYFDLEDKESAKQWIGL